MKYLKKSKVGFRSLDLELSEVQLKQNANYLLNKGSYTGMFMTSLGVLYDIVEP